MAMNTPYLGSSISAAGVTSGVSNLNTSYLSTGLTEITSALSVWGFLEGVGQIQSDLTLTGKSNLSIGGTTTLTGATTLGGALNSASAISGGAITGTAGTFSSVTVGTGLTTTSALSVRGLADFNSTRTQSGFLSYQTTASATSVILPDGGFGVYFLSATSCRLCFRSGNTTYTVIATTGAVL